MNAAPEKTALCCVCGEQRRCKQPRSMRDTDGRQIGDLKCAHCRRVTTHAVVYSIPMGERLDLILRGDDPDLHDSVYSADRLATMRDEYRRQQPQNPLLTHIWSERSADEARRDGEQLRAFCGVMVPVPAASESATVCGPVIVTMGGDYEAEDGETWTEGDCVDCARVANDRRRRRRRKAVAQRLVGVISNPSMLCDLDLDELEPILSRMFPG